MRFAHLKVTHRFERMRLRGLTGARDEFHLAANRAEPQDTRKPPLVPWQVRCIVACPVPQLSQVAIPVRLRQRTRRRYEVKKVSKEASPP
jgi:hypothetical protein